MPADTAPPQNRLIRLHPSDSVLIALADLPAGTPLPEGGATLGHIPRGHKVAATPIAAGASVRRYGQIIGVATEGIEPVPSALKRAGSGSSPVNS